MICFARDLLTALSYEINGENFENRMKSGIDINKSSVQHSAYLKFLMQAIESISNVAL